MMCEKAEVKELDQEEEKKTKLQKRVSVLVTIMLILTVLLCLYIVIQVLTNGYVNIGGYMMFRVVTGSMEPTIPVGALLVTKETEIAAVNLGDIICFRTQEAEIWGKIVTHRVVHVMEMADGSVMFRTRGDANLAVDQYVVDASNFVGKVIWHTGDDSVLAGIISFFTNKVGFLGCIVFPCLLLASLILKDCVSNIRLEMQKAVWELEAKEEETDWENDPLCGMTQEEYNEMYERIRAELIEELMHFAQISEDQTLSENQTEDRT